MKKIHRPHIVCYPNSCPSKTNKTLVPFHQKQKKTEVLVTILFCKDKASLSNFQLSLFTKSRIPPEVRSCL